MKKSTIYLIIILGVVALLAATAVLFGRTVLYKLSVSTSNLLDEEKAAVSACINNSAAEYQYTLDEVVIQAKLPNGSKRLDIRDYSAGEGVDQFIATRYNFDDFYYGLPQLKGYTTSEYDKKEYQGLTNADNMGKEPVGGRVVLTKNDGTGQVVVKYQWFTLRVFIYKSWFCVFTVEADVVADVDAVIGVG